MKKLVKRLKNIFFGQKDKKCKKFYEIEKK